ncbi:hypothetical protein L218DRAFT_1076791 [Marasmius fiardii PR-910]|nr:hypothetical protein L218DRAFT_1076791 [Marasmius fiardii PR-910]
MSVSVQPASARSSTTTTSIMRRKPKFTYQSPLPTDIRDPTTLISYSKKTTSQQPSAFQSPSPPAPASLSSFPTIKSKSSPPSTSLPLYHPLGRLALSLPPLDPAKYGLPMLSRPDTELLAQQAQQQAASSSSNGNKSWRTTPTGSRRDNSVAAAEDPGQTSATNTEVKEKPSPRKRRNGGGGGNRRKRKEADEDASYSAVNKRPRLPRGANTNASGNADEDSTANGGGNGDAEMQGTGGEEEKKVVERRTTRSRGAIARRDSTASETTSVSNSVSASVTRAASAVRKEEGEIAGGEVLSDGKKRSGSKEDGEVSEESK